MDTKSINRVLKSLVPGDPVEVLWNDACTSASRWTDHAEAAKMTLSTILTRGTLVTVRDDAVVVALDAGVLDDTGAIGDFHGIGIIERGAVKDIAKMRRVGRKK